jgi:bifunctional non-homologous end joining protein LigD
MLAAAGALPRSDTGWAYEMKWDGIRALADISAGQARLVSRLGREMTRSYPELRQLGPLPGWSSAVLDGEIVAFDAAGRPSFELLQQRMHVDDPARAVRLAARLPVSYLAFDVLVLDGRPLLAATYAERRSVLAGLHLPGPAWQVPPAFTAHRGADVLAVSRAHGLEGVVAKRLDSPYQPGTRSAAWVKIKNVRRQEVVVGGWRRGAGGRAGQVGSLLVGVYGPAGLWYAGHVGTGFTAATLLMLGRRLAPLRRDTSPFASPVPAEHARDVVWAEPRLVAEVEFGGWTSAGRLRAASFKGLLPDRDPARVVRETLIRRRTG